MDMRRVRHRPVLCAGLALLMGCIPGSIRKRVPLMEASAPEGVKVFDPYHPKATGEGSGVWVIMKRQVDLQALGARPEVRRSTRAERREAVLSAMEEVASIRRRRLDDPLRNEPGVDRLEGLTIVNGIVLWATDEIVARVAGRSDVAYLLEGRHSGSSLKEASLPATYLPGEGDQEEGEKRSAAGWWLETMGVGNGLPETTT